MTMVVDFADGFISNTAPTLLGLGNETFALLNNQSAWQDVAGLSLAGYSSTFATYEAEIKNASITYRQSGSVILRKDEVGGVWNMEFGGFIGDDLIQSAITLPQQIKIQVLPSGQVQYQTGNLVGAGYSGKLKMNINRINS